MRPTAAMWSIARAAARVVRHLPAALLAIDGAVALASTLVGVSAPDRIGATLLPVDLLDPDVAMTFVSALGTIALAVGVAREKRLARNLAVPILAAAGFVQVALLGHPLGGAVAVTCVAILLLDHRRFDVRASEAAGRDVAVTVLAALALAVAAVAIVGGTAVGLSARLSLVVESAVAVLSLGTPGPLDLLPRHGLSLGTVLAVARLPLAFGAFATLRPALPVSRARSLRAGALLRRHGGGALLPFQLAPGMRWFEAPAVEGVVAHAIAGRCAVALGDPIGPEHGGHDAWRAFVREMESDDLIPTLYQASEPWARHLRTEGWTAFAVGREAVIDLAAFDLRGGGRANLRHTVTRARRGGVTVAWFPDGIPEDRIELRAGLADVDAAWRADAGPELAFTISRFGPASVRAPIAVASSEGRPIAFTTFLAAGTQGWVLDLMRRVPRSTPGAVELCLVEAVSGLRDAGATTLSLGLAPLAFLDPRHGPREERALAVASRILRSAYDIDGLAFFKRKFDPRWEPRYAVVRSHGDAVELSLALLRLHAGGMRGLLRHAAAVVPLIWRRDAG